MMAEPTRQRVRLHTSEEVNVRIRAMTEADVARYMTASGRDIDRRLAELDREWDVERMLEANAAAFSLAGLGLAAVVSKKWLALPAVVAAFLLQHAVQGWCPPVPLFRRLGFRTEAEIDTERTALKFLRGDFTEAPARFKNASLVLEAAAR